jgi:hypothetical protein
MYAHHNTDNADTLPCNRNNCKCGNDNNCMYYNGSQNGHYNYVAVQGTGDRDSPHYKCPSAAYDSFNREGVYDDQVLNAGDVQLGAYNDLDPYGGVNDPKGWYGPAPLSYVEKPTCSGFTNGGDVDAVVDMEVPVQAQIARAQMGAQMQAEEDNNKTMFLILLAAGLGLLYLLKDNKISNQMALIIGLSILAVFFLQKRM